MAELLQGINDALNMIKEKVVEYEKARTVRLSLNPSRENVL